MVNDVNGRADASLSFRRSTPMIVVMDWHRLFGLVLTDFFTGSPYVVELEKDLSLKQQFLDVVIVRKQAGDFAGRLPDGLDNLADHNLITFKSHQETLDAYAIKELIGHYVNYRKQVSPSLEQLLPEESFRLYGVCASQPVQLAAQLELRQLQPGVLECMNAAGEPIRCDWWCFATCRSKSTTRPCTFSAPCEHR